MNAHEHEIAKTLTLTWKTQENRFCVWVFRADPNKVGEFEKLAVAFDDDRFEPTGGWFGDKPEVRPAINEVDA